MPDRLLCARVVKSEGKVKFEPFPQDRIKRQIAVIDAAKAFVSAYQKTAILPTEEYRALRHALDLLG